MKNVRIIDKNFKILYNSEDIQKKLSDIARAINNDYKGKETPLFLCMLSGAYLFTADLLRQITIPCEISFIKWSSYSGTESTGVIKEQMLPTIDVKDRDVIIIEDIVDTGVTMYNLSKKLKQLGAKSSRIATLLTKPSKLKASIKLDYVGFEIEDRFVIGYGMDYNERGRNLNAIYQLTEL
ncbi:MAG: hypoxanthine phosphoribosyltransferase [Bacteroidia bacterium]|nr:hypoxanthine phosphoribosyltransferase [Bacteroidia bacterium]